MKITILPKLYFEQLMSKIGDKSTDNSFFISILDPDCKEPIKEDSENYKSWWFWDVDTKVGNYDPINGRQARDIYDFIVANKDKKTCFVHCSAGVSRSGAVGTFINDFMQQDYKEFKRDNPNIMPNNLITSMLNRIHRKQQDISMKTINRSWKIQGI